MTLPSSSPRKAVVLAAGLGYRLRPLTLFQPKPLIPLGGVPLIERSLRQLEAWGVTAIAVNLHWQAELLRDYLRARQGRAVITFSEEPGLLGTAGALVPLRSFIGDDPFWMVNADIVWRLPPSLLLRPWRARRPLAALWLLPDKGPRTVETDAEGSITTYRSPRRGAPGTATFSGVQVVSPRIYDYLPARRPETALSLVEVYEAAARAGERVLGIASRGASHWDDAGSLPDYLRLRRSIRTVSVPAGVPPVQAPFTLARGGRLRFPSLVWPDPALAPTLLQAGWRLGRTTVEPLPPRGSDRSFLRVVGGAQSAIYVRYGCQRDENRRYAGHARLLREAGVAVPRVLAERPEARALLLEDGGACSLRDAVQADPGRIDRLYHAVLDQVVRLHTRATRLADACALDMEPAFDRRLYAWERDLFLEQIVRRRHRVAEAFTPGLLDEYDRVAEALLGVGRPVIVHRDLQSTNVLLHRGRVTLIDFQGMRRGAAAYDLGSLLADPYVGLPRGRREALLDYYARRVGGAEGDEARRLFPLGGVQRLTQALGAFGRLTALGLSDWQVHIVPAARILAELADSCGLAEIHRLAGATIAREQQLNR